MPFRFERLSIPEVILIEPTVYEDERGSFMEAYRYSEFAAFGIRDRFVQINHSCSAPAVLRGLHYQKNPRPQGKLVRAMIGEIFDVAVDIRFGSPTYGRWVSAVLSEDNRRMLYVPVGFAHGFCVVGKKADVFYHVSEEYSSGHDAGIIWSDPDIGISWPIRNPIVSAKDANHPRLKETETAFIYKGKT
jgi:dTDP-4-dehydrorhamnose 3,5-epimerase